MAAASRPGVDRGAPSSPEQPMAEGVSEGSFPGAAFLLREERGRRLANTDD